MTVNSGGNYLTPILESIALPVKKKNPATIIIVIKLLSYGTYDLVLNLSWKRKLKCWNLDYIQKKTIVLLVDFEEISSALTFNHCRRARIPFIVFLANKHVASVWMFLVEGTFHISSKKWNLGIWCHAWGSQKDWLCIIIRKFGVNHRF